MGAHMWQCCLKKDLESEPAPRDLPVLIELTADIAAQAYAECCYHSRQPLDTGTHASPPKDWPERLDVGVRRLSFDKSSRDGWQWYCVTVRQVPLFTVTKAS